MIPKVISVIFLKLLINNLLLQTFRLLPIMSHRRQELQAVAADGNRSLLPLKQYHHAVSFKLLVWNSRFMLSHQC